MSTTRYVNDPYSFRGQIPVEDALPNAHEQETREIRLRTVHAGRPIENPSWANQPYQLNLTQEPLINVYPTSAPFHSAPITPLVINNGERVAPHPAAFGISANQFPREQCGVARNFGGGAPTAPSPIGQRVASLPISGIPASQDIRLQLTPSTPMMMMNAAAPCPSFVRADCRCENHLIDDRRPHTPVCRHPEHHQNLTNQQGNGPCSLPRPIRARECPKCLSVRTKQLRVKKELGHFLCLWCQHKWRDAKLRSNEMASGFA